MIIDVYTSDPDNVDPLEIAAILTRHGYIVREVDVNDWERHWSDKYPGDVDRMWAAAAESRPPGREPYVGDGADGCRRSAQIDREEADGYDHDDDRRAAALVSAAAWELQAEREEQQ